MSGTLAIDVRGLTKSFGARPVVEGLDLQVPAGQVCGFLGGNGSGKTTTMRLLCGLLRPDAGEGACLGLDIRREAPAIRRQTGYMTQRFSLYPDLTVAENLAFVARLYQAPHAAIEATLERMDLAGRRGQFAGQLSGGWKQRLALAACVLHAPRLLLLDEPTAGVDAAARREFWDLIGDLAAEGMTVLVSTHYMDEAERCARVVYLAGGKLVVQGAAAEVVASAGLVVLEGSGAGHDAAVRALRAAPGVESATLYGATLRLVGRERAALEEAAATTPLAWHEVAPRLEDVFIHLLRHGSSPS